MLLHINDVKNLLHDIRRPLVQIKWFIETSILLAFARMLIKFIPFRYWRASLGEINSEAASYAHNDIDPKTIEKARFVGKCVRRFAKKMPFEAVCLPQAMAGRWMLSRRGIITQIFIGTKKNDDISAFDFHAWLMHGDLCLTGQHEKDQFQVFGRSKKPNSL